MPIDPASPAPSARGQSGGSAGSQWNDFPDRKLGHPPIATRGEPSTSSDVNASELMQNVVMNDDDKDWYHELSDEIGPTRRMKQATKRAQTKGFMPSTDIPNGKDVGLNCGPSAEPVIADSYRIMNCLGCVTNLCRIHITEGKKRDLLMEPEDVSKKKRKKQKKEANAIGAGGVRGAMDPGLRARKKNAIVNAKSFGGGSVVGKF